MSKCVKIILLIFCFCVGIHSSAQEMIHSVRPGDTFESIAIKYRIDTTSLKNANPLIETCHVGAKLIIPQTLDLSQSTNAPVVNDLVDVNDHVDPYLMIVDGLELMTRGKYSKAKKVFNKVLKIEEIPEVYYYRGLCYYKKYRWKPAYRDFNRVSKNTKLDASMRKDASELYEYTYAKHQEKVERRRAAFAEAGKALGVALLAVGTVAVGVMSENMTSGNSGTGYGTASSFYSNSSSNYNAPNFASMSSGEFDNYVTSQLNGLMAMTVAQHQQREMSEYQQFSTYNKKADGSDYSYQEFQAFKGQALMQMKEEGVDVVADMREQHRQNRIDQEEQRKKDKAAHFERMGYNAPTSTRSSSSTTKSTSYISTGSNTPSGSNHREKTLSVDDDKRKSAPKEEDKLDSKEQFKNEMVSSDDYKEIRKITLYERHGSSYKSRMKNVPLCRKGAYYFVKIGGVYYNVSYSNWQQFNREIVYGTQALYFNL